MIIRTATSQDWPGIKRVLMSAIDDSSFSSYWPELMDKGLIFVTEQNGEVIGFGAFYEREKEIESLYVMKEHQGKGVGSALLAKLENVASERGIRKVKIEAAFGSEMFYDRKGYKRIREEGPPHRKLVIMKKKLKNKNDGA